METILKSNYINFYKSSSHSINALPHLVFRKGGLVLLHLQITEEVTDPSPWVWRAGLPFQMKVIEPPCKSDMLVPSRPN